MSTTKNVTEDKKEKFYLVEPKSKQSFEMWFEMGGGGKEFKMALGITLVGKPIEHGIQTGDYPTHISIISYCSFAASCGGFVSNRECFYEH